MYILIKLLSIIQILIVVFGLNNVAREFNLPLVNPYLERDADFSQGANFAVAGATAINATGYVGSPTKSSLPVQLGWFQSHIKSVCSSLSGILLSIPILNIYWHVYIYIWSIYLCISTSFILELWTDPRHEFNTNLYFIFHLGMQIVRRNWKWVCLWWGK